MRYISQITARMPTFLLSNTNAIHLAHFNALLKRHAGEKDLSSFFRKVYLSHEIRMRKPDAEAFQLILDEQELDPASTLFIDDSPQHIESAGKLGLQTLHLTSIHVLEQELRPFLA